MQELKAGIPLTANIVSFGGGMLIAELMPIIF
jgi:hypothetical protein